MIAQAMLLVTNNAIYQMRANKRTKIGDLINNSYRKKINFKGFIYFLEYFNQNIIFYKINGIALTKIKQISFPQNLTIKFINFFESNSGELMVYYLYEQASQSGIYIEYHNLSTNEESFIFDDQIKIDKIFASCSLLESQYFVVTLPNDNIKKLIHFHDYQWKTIASFRNSSVNEVIMQVINNYVYIAIASVLYRVTNSSKPTLVVDTIFENNIIGLTPCPSWHNNSNFYLLLNDGSLYCNNILNNNLTLVTKFPIKTYGILTWQFINFYKNELMITAQQIQDNSKYDVFFFITEDKKTTIQKYANKFNIINIWG
ncbi:hypothetical protein [Spiroplasma endosymbiont of Stenodema calcarata]|uniref:hypothetical protein n=1 Tax=Spiroplasma endosymbiont of Stenodema calcarata TaxID=3139328 RepID=UPI003CCB42F5